MASIVLCILCIPVLSSSGKKENSFNVLNLFFEQGLMVSGRIPNKQMQNGRAVENVWDHKSKSQLGIRQEKVKVRGGTRVPCDIPITAVSLDPLYPFSESCRVILVNPNGCSIRISRAVEPGTPVRLQGLPILKVVTARVRLVSIWVIRKNFGCWA